jgi:hypothetical protein
VLLLEGGLHLVMPISSLAVLELRGPQPHKSNHFALFECRLCAGRLVLLHEGGYSELVVPFCGLAVLEQLSGIRTGVTDPHLEEVNNWGYQSLQVCCPALLRLLSPVPGGGQARHRSTPIARVGPGVPAGAWGTTSLADLSAWKPAHQLQEALVCWTG